MYPEVFAEFARYVRDYSDLSVMPTPAFFYGLKPGEEISVAIEEGKTLSSPDQYRCCGCRRTPDGPV